MRYNSYIIKDNKTVLLDTADKSVRNEFMNNVEDTLSGKPLDYLIIHHAEPDHSSLISEILSLHPETTLVTNATALKFINQFTGNDFTSKTKIIKEGDDLSLGKHTLKFIFAPMVHWPEVFVSYDETNKILFSADAFGSFGANEGNILVSSLENINHWTDEARRYYTNIVGRFGINVTNLLKKTATIDIQKICPLHGHIFDTDCTHAIEKYKLWSSYTPECDDVLIIYGSMYGHTKAAVDVLADILAQKNKQSKAVDISYTEFSFIISDCFKYRNIIFACPTYYNMLFPKMEQLFEILKKLDFSSHRIGFIENGTWSPNTVKLMKELFSSLTTDLTLPSVTIKSAMNKNSFLQLQELADALLKK